MSKAGSAVILQLEKFGEDLYTDNKATPSCTSQLLVVSFVDVVLLLEHRRHLDEETKKYSLADARDHSPDYRASVHDDVFDTRV